MLPLPLYFSLRLKSRLREILIAKSVLVEAPSGYGKTTALEDCLRSMLPEGAFWIRHVCAEESQHSAWRRLCNTVAKVDAATGEALLRHALPDEDSFGDIAEMLRVLPSTESVWLVIDDFHRIADLLPVTVWKSFLEHESLGLHLVLAARPYTSVVESVMPYEKAGLLRVGLKDLRLTAKEGEEYFAMAGARLSAEQKRELHRRTEGWIIALSLHLRHYLETGTLAPASCIASLLRDVVWDNLDDEKKDFFLRISPFESWTQEQAAHLLGLAELPEEMASFLRNSTFIRFSLDTGLYSPHSSLMEFIRGHRNLLPEARQRDILSAAADWSAVHGPRERAIALYYLLRDVEKILSLDLSGLDETHIIRGGINYAEALRDIAALCTKDLMLRYPESVMQISFELLGEGCYQEASALCTYMEGLLDRLAPDRKKWVQARILLQRAFGAYNNLAQMKDRMEELAAFTEGRSTLMFINRSWTFGNASVLMMYHRDAGRLDAELNDMDAYASWHIAFAGGHGSGCAVLMRAEALFCRGETYEAEILGHKARHAAELREQFAVVIAAELLMGRLALQRGNAVEFAAAVARLMQHAEASPRMPNRLEAEMALAFLASLKGRPEEAAVWLGGDYTAFSSARLIGRALPYARMCRAKLLLAKKPEILLGEWDATPGPEYGGTHLLARIYDHIHVGAAWGMLGMPERAESEFGMALELAEPDGLLMPFAEDQRLVKYLPDKGESAFVADILAMARKHNAGRLAVLQELHPEGNPFGLTSREMEIAQLAYEGLTNSEIANKVCVSLNTIKTHMASILRKSGLPGRQSLHRLFRNN